MSHNTSHVRGRITPVWWLRWRLVWLLPMLLAAACATVPPTQEMSDARMAVKAAKSAGAAQYARPWFDSAELLINDAERALVHHDFDTARDRALIAKGMAVSARTVAVAITRAREAYAQAVARGAKPEAAHALIEQADAAARHGDETGALKAAGKAMQRLRNAQGGG